MFEEEDFDSLPIIFSTGGPKELAFLYALSEKPYSPQRQSIIKGMLERTSKLSGENESVINMDAWLALRSYLCIVEGSELLDTNYLTTRSEVRKKSGELAKKADPQRLLECWGDWPKGKLVDFLMAECANNQFENEGTYIPREEARKEAERQILLYVEKINSLLSNDGRSV